MEWRQCCFVPLAIIKGSLWRSTVWIKAAAAAIMQQKISILLNSCNSESLVEAGKHDAQHYQNKGKWEVTPSMSKSKENIMI